MGRNNLPITYQPQSSDLTAGQREVTVVLDADLLDQLDQLTEDRDRAIAAGIKLWCERQSGYKLRHSMNAQRDRHDQDETGWLI